MNRDECLQAKNLKNKKSSISYVLSALDLMIL